MAAKITKIGYTNDKISARGGLPLFLRYVQQIGFYSVITSTLFFLNPFKGKGLKMVSFFTQMFAFFIDGTNMAISNFDQSKKDEAYAALLECHTDQLASSHQIKRYFKRLSTVSSLIFNKILHELFIWRLLIEKPAIIELGVDTMVLDNDTASKKEGNTFTYKRVKGFQPLHICWGRFLIDVLFREGSANSNHGTDYPDRIRAISKLIRKRYSQEVPIIICTDSGFADQKVFEIFEQDLNIHYITTSNHYTALKEFTKDHEYDDKQVIKKDKTIWQFAEIGNKLGSWKKFRRCIITKLLCDGNGQYVMGLDSVESVIYTNIGNCPIADQRLMAAGGSDYFKSEIIIEKIHKRGADELIHRSIKELATKEQLPFKSFGMNRAYYFIIVFTHFIFETYKQDVTAQVLPITSYPNTFRRKLIDFAVKITSHSRNTIMNVNKTVFKNINITELWKLCQSPPRIQFT